MVAMGMGGAGKLLSLAACAALVGCCCRVSPVASGHAAPLPAALVYPPPPDVAAVAVADTIVHTEMHNVHFHVDDTILLRIRVLRGTARDLGGEHVIVLDDKRRFELQIAYAELGLTARDLSDLLNRYVFGYRGAPLKGLEVRLRPPGIEQSGVLHKVVDIPFDMQATLSVTPEGLIRLHPTSMKIFSVPGKGLLAALGITLEKLIDVRGAKGVSVQGNDLLLDPVRILPPPRITGRLTAIRVEANEVVQVFGSPCAPGAEPLVPPQPAPNFVLFRGGTLRFGKLFMVRAELEAIDEDPSDPFDFYLDYYNSQLVAGYHRTLPDGGLVAWMPDFPKLDRAKHAAVPVRN